MISTHPLPYPLTWPDTIPRTARRSGSRFKSNLTTAMNNVNNSLRRFGDDSSKQVKNVVISSNVTLGVSKPEDPGVAVWFAWDGLNVSVAVDRYEKVEDNIQAIHHIIEARRTELRHGGLNIVRATFSGLTALPPPNPKPHWSHVLGVTQGSSKAAVEAAFKSRAKAIHPDKGGASEQMAELNRARAEALKEVS
ncbi:J domain-containing protein [Roseibium album]|uniref:J domain-containing protein n=1 Tax=Roseibium album TaxID=311410 RepID=UPI00391D93F2